MSYTREESYIGFCADTPCHINTIAKNAKKHLFILQVLFHKKNTDCKTTLFFDMAKFNFKQR